MAKKFDVKQFLLQRGEQIGLAVAGLVMLVLVVPALLAFLTAGSATDKAKDLDDQAAYVERALNDPNNVPTETDRPAADTSDKLIALTSDVIKAGDYRLNPLIPEGAGQIGGRRPPKVLAIAEAKADFARVQIKSLIFSEGNPPQIYVLESEDGEKGTGGPAAMSPGGRRSMAAYNNLAQQGGVSGTLGKRGKPKTVGMFGPQDQGLSVDGKKDRKMKPIPVTEVGKNSGEQEAVRVKYLRLAVIAASFPYKKQVDEFRTRLALRDTEAVLTEQSTQTASVPGQDTKQPLGNFRFLGVEVQRRELDGNGKPVGTGEFEPLDVVGDYKPYVVLTGRDFEPEDPVLKPLVFPGLVMARLKQLRTNEAAAAASGPGGSAVPPGPGPGTRPALGGSGRPGGPRPGGAMTGGAEADSGKRAVSKEQYPAVESKLETLNKTLEEFKEKPAPVAAPPRFSLDGFDPFTPPTSDDTTTAGPGAVPGKPGVTGTNPVPGGLDTKGPASVLPDYCLVRVIDVNILSGKTYEYRMRIRMANPNFGRRDVASPAYARDAELVSEWSKMPITVRTDAELNYYAVDQKQWEIENHKEKAGRFRYTGPYANDMYRDIQGNLSSFNRNLQVVLQAHRWLQNLPFGEPKVEVGEWIVAERMPVFRGEYVGQKERVQVPYWRTARADWVIANDGTNKKVPGLQVTFGYEGTAMEQPEAILVDFHNGALGYDRVVSRNEDKPVVQSIRDASAGEVLILNPDGTLILREGAQDATDKQRQDRLKEVKDRLKDVKTPGSAGGAGKGFSDS